jgi:hypothetical protein
LIQSTGRPELIRRALAAKSLAKTTATADVVKACEELAKS